MADKKQLVVIGAGPGGYAAAFLAADRGMDVALIDKEMNPGGVCLYRGCIPSKALLHVAKLLHETKQAKAWGIEFGEPKIDIDKLREFKNNVVTKLTSGTGQLAKQRKIEYIQGTAQFTGSNSVKIETADGERDLEYENAILATGSKPFIIPSLKIDSPRLLDSTTALDIEDVPEKLLVIGGGYIGLELGSVYAQLGSKVSVVEMTDGLLPGADRDLVRVLARRIDEDMEAVYLNTKVVELKEVENGISVKFEGDLEEKEQVFDKVLMSVGRKPVTEGLGLENTKIEVNQGGWVKIDEKRQTTDPAIYAIGDIAGEPMLAHKANAEAKVAVEAIQGHKVAFEPHAIPGVVFTDPELAWAGLTEAEAKEQGIPVEVARFSWAASGRAITLDRTDGMTKLIMEPETGRILGMGIVGAGAGELISEGVLAIEMAAVAEDVAHTIHPHPTISETVMESAEMFFGESTHMYKPKRKKKK